MYGMYSEANLYNSSSTRQADDILKANEHSMKGTGFSSLFSSLLKGIPVLGAAFDIGTGIYDRLQANKVNKANLAMQQEQQKYERDMLQRSWEREDTAVQRRTADLRASGLSPTLAAGSAASSSPPIKSQAPKEEYTPTRAQLVMDAIRQRADVSKTLLENEVVKAQMRNYNAQAWRTEWDNAWLKKNNQPSFTSPIYKDLSSLASQLFPGVKIPSVPSMVNTPDNPVGLIVDKYRNFTMDVSGVKGISRTEYDRLKAKGFWSRTPVESRKMYKFEKDNNLKHFGGG